MFRIALTLLLMLMSATAAAFMYTIPKKGNIIGDIESIHSKSGDTLARIAERFSIGQAAMQKANPELGSKKLKVGTPVIIPSQFYLPTTAPRSGLVLNLAEMRAYYYLNTKTVSTYPMGIGREGWDTPLGQSSVVFKEEHPAWHPPPSIRAEAAHKGHPLPLVIPAGSHNPLGHYAIHLGISGILVHGTTQPQSVGRRSSHGCMRMYAQDIKHLFELIPIGTPVYLIHEVHHGT